MYPSKDRENAKVGNSFWRLLRRLLREQRGNIAVMTALLVIPLAGVLGMATEASSWFLIHRAAQNAADSAVIAEATNAKNGGSTYKTEALAVAAHFGFVNGASDTVVTPYDPASYSYVNPDCVSPKTCYKVTVTKTVPVTLLGVVGYHGTNDGGLQTISATAIATTTSVLAPYCIVSLGTGDAFHINGAGQKPNLAGCRVRSNGDVTCNGANSTANVDQFVFGGANKSCSPVLPSSTTYPDPYASAYGNDPTIMSPITNAVASKCTSGGSSTNAASYPQEPVKTKDPPLPSSNILSTLTVSWGATQVFCGDVQLANDVTVNAASGGTVLVIANGKLDLNNHTLNGSGLTVVFTGPTISGFSPAHTLSCSGTLSVGSPSNGSWKGVAVWQDSTLTSGLDMSCSGNQPTWNVTGLVYMPKANLQFAGAVNKYANIDCFSLVDYTFQASGGVQILERESQCSQIGLTPPEEANSYIGKLVY